MTRRRRLILLGLVYAALLIGGGALGGWLMQFATLDIRPSTERQIHAMIMTVAGLYLLASAVPFVPGAEIGLALILAFGTPIILLVYGAMIAALTLSYAIGRLVPASAIAAVFRGLGLQRARTLVEDLAPLTGEERLQRLIARAPRRIVPFLLRHRYVALALAFNLPGNSLVGGGGGIALAAGMSRLFPAPAYLLTIALAVAPVPLFFLLTGVR
ncbi:MAG: hypothetical protein GVY13_19115 [Alphaproteobacteria bacterium]|nr:hypothetical protein [Alphaproteobacteria bacterium]